jgi:anti-sigma regulatory factor (Ser/Thr protein kinase)
MSRTLAFTIGDPSQIAEARRAAVALAAGLGFTETEAGRVAIVATEMARNLVAHATRSRQFLLRALRESAWDASGSPAPAGVEMIALDKGPGIANIAQCMRDGHSSAGTPGTGLGAIFRLAGVCDIHSVRDAGTALLAQVWRTPGPPPREPGWTEVGAACVPKPRETHNGDNWAVRRESGRTVLLVADGLGHGQFAAAASDAAVAAFEAHPGLPPAGIIEVVHAALRSTRGAAVGALEMDPTKGVARFAGVGNIAGTILTEDQRKALVSHNGTAGGEIRRIEEFRYPWLKDAVAVVHSDGLSGRGGPDDYPGLSAKHPGIIAGVLYRDLARGTDDVTVVVAKRSSVG